MATSYFILTKPKNQDVSYNGDNNIATTTGKITYILPQTLLTCYADRGLFESGLIEWCKQFCSKDKILLDIGAHTGTYALSLADHVKHVHAFEPQKMTYYSLCGGVSLSNMTNITCHNFGLGSQDQEGMLTLHIVSNDGGGSSISPDTDNILDSEEIQVKTLDSLQLKDIGFIKMDVENNEEFVINGGLETLKNSNYPPIMFECNDREAYSSLFSLLEKLTYKIVPLTGAQNMFLASQQ
jgi:FkbM family methyltransferase